MLQLLGGPTDHPCLPQPASQPDMAVQHALHSSGGLIILSLWQGHCQVSPDMASQFPDTVVIHNVSATLLPVFYKWHIYIVM